MRESTILLEERQEAVTAERQQELPNAYGYEGFAGWAGERYLKRVLRQILPLALYRTWEIFVEYQGRGNDCYLSVPQLARLAGRTLRTMQKDLATLAARHLLVERAARKPCPGPDHTVHSRVVVVKDFAQLYALAHEYHEWLHATDYIPPDRTVSELILPNAPLLAKLRRFDNYRRVLYNQRPGPAPRAQEEDRWFTDYQAEAPISSEEEKQTTHGGWLETDGGAKKEVSTERFKDLPKDSPKRINERFSNERTKRDGFDSASLSSERCGTEETENPRQQTPRQTHQAKDLQHKYNVASHETSYLAPTASIPNQPKIRLENATARGGGYQASSSQRKQATLCHAGSRSCGSGQALVRSFVQEVSGPFGDLNPKGSVTRILAMLASAPLDDPDDILLCLVRAYTIARDTGTIRPQHWNQQAGRANRMPLFCTMFQRLTQARAQGHHREYTWQQMQEDIAADALLTHWQHEQWEYVSHLADDLTADDPTDEPEETHPLPSSPFSEQMLPETTLSVPRAFPRQSPRSQTTEEREARAAHARSVRAQLSRMAVAINDPIIWSEHITCGCLLFHKQAGKDVCALCSPDPTWSEEVRRLISSLVERQSSAETTSEPGHETGTQYPDEALSKGGGSGQDACPWTEREDAYAWGMYLLEALAASGHTAEMEVRASEEWYHVILRSAGCEVIMDTPEQVQVVLEEVADDARAARDAASARWRGGK